MFNRFIIIKKFLLFFITLYKNELKEYKFWWQKKIRNKKINKTDYITENLLKNGLNKIVKMQNLSLNELKQIERMNNLSLNELKQMAITRRIKNYKDMSKKVY